MNGEPVTDLTTAVYEMRSVSLQNRNSDILPRHMGQLGFDARDEDEKRAYGGLKGSPTVIFVFPQGGEQFTTRKAQLGVQRHPTTRGDVVLVQLAARVPPFLPYLNGRVLIPGHSCLSGRLIPNSPGSTVQ